MAAAAAVLQAADANAAAAAQNEQVGHNAGVGEERTTPDSRFHSHAANLTRSWR